MRPPGLEDVGSFDMLSPWMQAKLLAYSQIRQYERDQELELMAVAAGAKFT